MFYRQGDPARGGCAPLARKISATARMSKCGSFTKGRRVARTVSAGSTKDYGAQDAIRTLPNPAQVPPWRARNAPNSHPNTRQPAATGRLRARPSSVRRQNPNARSRPEGTTTWICVPRRRPSQSLPTATPLQGGRARRSTPLGVVRAFARLTRQGAGRRCRRAGSCPH